MTNSHIIDTTKDLLSLVKTNARFIITTSLLFFILGVIFSFSLSPKFEVSSEILPKEDQDAGMQQNNPLIGMLTQNSKQNDLSYFQRKMYSSAVSKVLWEMGYDQIFFSGAFNPSSNSYEFQPSSWQKIKSKILGYEINTLIDHQSLSDFIQDSFALETLKDSSSSYFITQQQDPQPYLNFLQDLMKVTDNQIKQDKLVNITDRIQFLTAKIKTTNEVSIQSALMTLLERALLEEALLSDESSYYSIKVVDGPKISRNPTFINLQFIYFGFLLLGFFASIIYLLTRKLFFNISH